MLRLIFLLLVSAALTGCGLFPQRYKPQAVPAQCDSMCYAPCVGKDGDTGVRVTGDPNDASTWDEIGELLASAFREKLESCDAHREACVKCLQRQQKAGVLTLP